ncbi:hypothetical protein H4R19_004814 [Coemansia spiralis]|nr:hypothetical protein H4R19_004814 [Coemansia spiralis]
MDHNYQHGYGGGYGGAQQPYPGQSQQYPDQQYPGQQQQPQQPQQHGYEYYAGQAQGSAPPPSSYAGTQYDGTQYDGAQYGAPQHEYGHEAQGYDQARPDEKSQQGHGYDDQSHGYSDQNRGYDDDNETTDRGVKDFFMKTKVDEYGTEHSGFNYTKASLVGGAAIVGGLLLKKHLDKRKAEKEQQMQMEINGSTYAPPGAYKSETVINQSEYNPYGSSKHH